MKKLFSVTLAVIMTMLLLVPVASALSGKLDKDIAAETRQIAVDIESEGVVLLKNEDNVLPLEGKKINVFGAGSIVPFFGGAGSGAVTTEDPVDFYEALDTAKIEYNTELKALYEKNCKGNEVIKTDNTVLNNLIQLIAAKSSLDEMPVSKLTDSVMNNAVSFSDTAVIVISRTSRETSDLDEETLRLTSDEKALVEKVTSAFENVIVLFNTGNIMEMGWLDEYDSIKAAALIWIPGEFGMEGVGKILSGEVTPSGRLADTVAYKPTDHPSSQCFGDHGYQGADEYYVEYLEGIYIGYRYFETFAPDKVQYPFGYGLSYTSFEKTNASFTNDGEKITASVTVTNTGSRSGKEVVELYYSAPYINGGIEKSAINLGTFTKTKILAPGESETVTLTLKISDMASYDYKNEEAWVLDTGDYNIFLSDNVRTHYASYTLNIPEKIVNKYDSKTGVEIKNLFSQANGGFTVLSRADKDSTYPVCRTLTASDDIKNADALPKEKAEGEAPKMGVKYDKTITLKDVSEDESLWDAFLDQLTLEEMTLMVINGGYETQGIERLGIPATMDNDGPSSVKGRNGQLYVDCGTAYPCETAIACTWNTELAEIHGQGVGKEAKDIGTDIWYAPAVTIHRNPMAGRNFEYFSEDPVISAKMAAAIIRGANKEDLVTTIKHFAMNEQETHRNGIFTWADEQTMREIYLKAFEEPIKEANPVGLMSAYNRIGTSWCGGNKALLTDLLRTEWGFEGFVVSDYSTNMTGTGYMNPVLAVYAGNDTILTGLYSFSKPSHVIAVQTAYYRDPVGFGNALRSACKNLCIAKMHTNAFLHPERTFDSSLQSTLVKPEDWNLEFPYIWSIIRYVFNNLANVVIYALRFIM